MTKYQTGQTIIETVVAIFIMVMGITAALGLATYSLSASTSIRKQIIGVGLAREGIEAVKNIRDTNWLVGTLSANCQNFVDGSNNSNCYKDWLTAGGLFYNINPPNPGNYALSRDPSGQNFWFLISTLGPWGLNSSIDPTYGIYTPFLGGPAGSSDFYRKITISTTTSPAPFNNPDVGPRLNVISQVWWKDKNCPPSSNWPGPGKCSIELNMVLTNWKTY